MRKKVLKTKQICALLLTAVMALGLAFTSVGAGGDEKDPDTGDLAIVGVPGEYSSETKDYVLNRINEIRKEACDEGIVFRGKKLTPADYHPIKWSSDLEELTQTRAAEAAVNEDHTRPDGTPWSTVFEESDIKWMSASENLAWGSGMKRAIEQWYDEKSDLVNNTGGVTGHYENLINPNSNYMALSSFRSLSSNWTTTEGLFIKAPEGLDESKLDDLELGMALINVKTSSLEELEICCMDNEDGEVQPVDIGEDEELTLLGYSVNKDVYDDDFATVVIVFYDISWSSSDSSIATVDDFGIVTGVSEGDAVIIASIGNNVVRKSIRVNDPNPVEESTGDNEIPFEEESSEPETEAPTAPIEPETEAPTEPETEAPTEPETEPETEAPTEPETEAPTEPETEAPTEPETEAPTEPETQVPTEPETQAPTEPETEAPTEPETQAPTEPETEAPTEPETQAPTEPETEAPTEPETQAPTEPETEVPTEPETQAPTEPETEAPTEAPTEPETQAPTEPETQAPTEPETQAPTEPETQAPTEPETEAPTEPETQAPTEPETQAPTEPETEEASSSAEESSEAVETSSSDAGNGGSGVDTGDSAVLLPTFIAMLISMCVAVVFVIRKRRFIDR
ncbi:MAG: Ig-like domain-containing protein [Lachnospiraceae bacterium]|nr:Ig-like domain-containing protein [Lachnospiraceae bacterium]